MNFLIKRSVCYVFKNLLTQKRTILHKQYFSMFSTEVKRQVRTQESSLSEKVEDQIDKDSSLVLPSGLTKLTLNIWKYLENNQKIYRRLCDESIKISYDIADKEKATEVLKNELVRINRQINEFSRENYLHEEMTKLLQGIQEAEELVKEATEIGDEEIKESAIKETAEMRNSLKQLETEIIEFLIPDDSVSTTDSK